MGLALDKNVARADARFLYRSVEAVLCRFREELQLAPGDLRTAD